MDLSKLSPAPWSVRVMSRTDGGCELFDRAVVDDKSNVVCYMPSNYPPGEADDSGVCLGDHDQANAESIALARNAFEVMMRRGWTSRRLSTGRWLVQNNRNEPLQQQHLRAGRLDWFEADDPFTCLIEADRWYRENVESK